MDLGPSHGIRFRFDDGLLGAVLLDMHRKPLLPVREHLTGAGVHAEPPTAPEVPATRARQRLGVGERELDLVATHDDGITSTLEQRFDLRAPMDWWLDVDGTAEPTGQGVGYRLSGNVTLTVQTPEPWEVHRGGLRVALPAGSSTVVLAVSSRPIFDVGETLVVCRPDQMVEAAVVASCLPTDRLTPVIALEPPPMTETDYIRLYDEFDRSKENTLRLVGTPLGRAEVVSGSPELQLRALRNFAEHASLAKALSEYRSWLKHNEMISGLVSRLGVGRAVFLHDFAPEELNTVDPGMRERLDQEWEAHTGENAHDPGDRMFGDVPETLRLRWTGLTDLTTAAWRSLRDPAGEPERTIEVCAHDRGSCVAALFVALRTGAALRAVDRPGTGLDALFTEANPDSDEAVLVENTADVSALWAALYAHHRGARLVITPRPDLGPVRQAVDERQRRITATGRAIDAANRGEEDEGARGGGADVEAGGVQGRGVAFASGLRRWLPYPGRNPYRRLEEAVTAQVPNAAVAAVGERRLTAFTTGLPYSFVRTPQADWSRKPIGHVAADPALIVLNELYSEGIERSPGAFSLVFDPGFFKVSETEDVMRSVGGHFTHPILLPGPDEVMLGALQSLPKDLPVELIFFNTHGLDDGIVLGERYTLPNWRIPQWVTLPHRPVVFNNSCQSWTGVGREFVRVGARGYIGSLWSVPAKPAADFGRTVVHRITAEEAAVCAAIVNTGLPPRIERSYIYVGTANGRLDQWRDRAATAGEAALAWCSMLGRAALDNDGDLARLLHREITALRRTVEATPHGRTVSCLDVLLIELGLTVTAEPLDEASAHELAVKIDSLLSLLDLPEDASDRRRATRFELTGTLHERTGALAAALADLRRSVAYGEACGNRANLLLRMTEMHMKQGDLEEPLRLAQRARALFLDEDDQRGLLRTSGVLGQLSKRLGRRDEAMRHARDGYARAVHLADRREQGAFKLDEATLHQVGGNVDAAIAAATEALDLFRVGRHDHGELAAVGRLCMCHLDKGDLETSERYATTGLAQAHKLGLPVETACFHRDVGETLARRGHDAQALPHYRDAADILAGLGHWELAAPMLASLNDCAARLEDADALWSTAMWGSSLCSAVERHLWEMVLPLVVDALKTAIVVGTFDTTKHRLGDLLAVAPADLSEDRPEQMRFLGGVLTLVVHWLTGRDQAGVTSLARLLDGQIEGVELGLEEFVSLPYFQRAPRHGVPLDRRTGGA
ncbi:tetratricopeptide repeat protein [Streptomyces sp. NPDC005209]|uniref:tetratricopeptide repeat protein n=1 Tax=Streptomyces sp. NPDC005209 TaxID=3156715 RepID=UPI0033B4B80F